MEGIEDLVEILENQQERANEEGDDEEPNEPGTSGGSSNPTTNNPCWAAYRRYQAAVDKKNYLQANQLLKAYQTCLRANRNKAVPLGKR